MLELRDGTRKSDKQFSYSLESASNQPTHWLILCWSTFGARTSQGQPWTHKTHHDLNSEEATTFPHIVYYAPLCKGWKLPRLELPQFHGAITLCSDLRSRRGLKQSCSSCQELSSGVSHATRMHGNRVNSRHFVVGSQTVKLTPSLSFYHNLCYKYPNGSCELILNIYTSITFQ
jgi:hypothetical protein